MPIDTTARQDRGQLPRFFSVFLFLFIAIFSKVASADNLGAIGDLGILVVAFLVVIGFMILFIVFSILLRLVAKGKLSRIAPYLIIVARVFVVAWYLTALIPIIYNLIYASPLGHDLGWMVFASVVGGLPAHIPSIVTLFLASSAKESLSLKTRPASTGNGVCR